MSSRTLPPPEECAQCGSVIPRQAKACPDCGADERTGWRETSVYDGLDLPEATNDYAPENTDRQKRHGLAWYWWLTATGLFLLLALAALALR